MQLQLKILDLRIGKEFPMPKYATSGSAAFDLIAAIDEPLELVVNSRSLIPSGISIYIADQQYAGFIFPRSGLGHKQGIVLGNGVGVIDSDYQGEIKVSLFNTGQKNYTIQPGDRIAQLSIMPVQQVDFKIVDNFTLASTRGSGGFGHTGKD